MESVLVDNLPWNIYPVDVTNLMPPLNENVSSSENNNNNGDEQEDGNNNNNNSTAAAVVARRNSSNNINNNNSSSIPQPLFHPSSNSILITAARDQDVHTVNWVRSAQQQQQMIEQENSNNNENNNVMNQPLPASRQESSTTASNENEIPSRQQTSDSQTFSASATIDTLDEQLLSQRIEGLLCGISSYVISVGNSGAGPRAVLVGSPEVPGLIPRACEILLSRLKVPSVQRVHSPFAVATSFVALLPTRVIDLCDPNNMAVRVSMGREGYVINAKRRLAESADDALDTLDEGLETERALTEAGELPACGAATVVFSVMFTSNTGTAASLVFVLVGAVRSPQNRSAIDTLMSSLQVMKENYMELTPTTTPPQESSEGYSVPSTNNNNENNTPNISVSPPKRNNNNNSRSPSTTNNNSLLALNSYVPPDLLQTCPLTRLLSSILRPVGTWNVDFIAAFEATDGVAALAKRKYHQQQQQENYDDNENENNNNDSPKIVARKTPAAALQQPISLPQNSVDVENNNSNNKLSDNSEEQDTSFVDLVAPSTPPPHTSPGLSPSNPQTTEEENEEVGTSKVKNNEGKTQQEQEQEQDDDQAADYEAISELREHSTDAGDDDSTTYEGSTSVAGGGRNIIGGAGESNADDDDDDNNNGAVRLGSGTLGSGGGGKISDQPADVMSAMLPNTENEEQQLGCYASPSVAAAIDSLHTLLHLLELAHIPVTRPLHDTIETVCFAPKRKKHPYRLIKKKNKRNEEDDVDNNNEEEEQEQKEEEGEGENNSEFNKQQQQQNQQEQEQDQSLATAFANSNTTRVQELLGELDTAFQEHLDEFLTPSNVGSYSSNDNVIGGGDSDEQTIPLPLGWEEQFTAEGQAYYVDHVHRATSWEDPRAIYYKSQLPQSTISDAGVPSLQSTRMVFRDPAAISGTAPVAQTEPSSPVAVLLVRPVDDVDDDENDHYQHTSSSQHLGEKKKNKNYDKVEILLPGETCSSVEQVPKDVLEELVSTASSSSTATNKNKNLSTTTKFHKSLQQQQEDARNNNNYDQNENNNNYSSSIGGEKSTSSKQRGPLTLEEAYNVLWSQPLDGSTVSTTASSTTAATITANAISNQQQSTSSSRRSSSGGGNMMATTSSRSSSLAFSTTSSTSPFTDTDEDIQEIIQECENVLKELKRQKIQEKLLKVEIEELQLGNSSREGHLLVLLGAMHRRALHAENSWMQTTNLLKESEAARQHEKERANEVQEALISKIKELETMPAPKPLSAADAALLDHSNISSKNVENATTTTPTKSAADEAGDDEQQQQQEQHSILTDHAATSNRSNSSPQGVVGDTTAERFVVAKLKGRLRKADTTIQELQSVVAKYRQIASEGPAIVAATSLSPKKRIEALIKVRSRVQVSEEAQLFSLAQHLRQQLEAAEIAEKNVLAVDENKKQESSSSSSSSVANNLLEKAILEPSPEHSDLSSEISFIEASVSRLLTEREASKVELQKHRDTLSRVPDLLRDLCEKQQSHIKTIRSALENQNNKTKHTYEDKMKNLKRLHEIALADLRSEMKNIKTGYQLQIQKQDKEYHHLLLEQQKKVEEVIIKMEEKQIAKQQQQNRERQAEEKEDDETEKEKETEEVTKSTCTTNATNTPTDSSISVDSQHNAQHNNSRREDFDIKVFGENRGNITPRNTTATTSGKRRDKRKDTSGLVATTKGGKHQIPIPNFRQPLYQGLGEQMNNYHNHLRSETVSGGGGTPPATRK